MAIIRSLALLLPLLAMTAAAAWAEIGLTSSGSSTSLRVDNTTIVKGTNGVLSATGRTVGNNPMVNAYCNGNPMANGDLCVAKTGVRSYFSGVLAGLPSVLYQTATPQSVGGTTAETTLATYTVKGGTLGLNGKLRATPLVTTSSASSTKTIKLYYGAWNFYQTAITTSKTWSGEVYLQNRGSAASQVAFLPGATTYAASSNSAPTSTVDSAVDQTFTVTGATQLETAINTTAVTADGVNCTVTVASGAFNNGEYVYTTGITMSGASSSCANVGTTSASTVAVTNLSATQFRYACPCANGTSASVQGTVQRFSVITLEGLTLELLPGAN